ncbi:MAG: TIGR02584 family CRISPR-associated protein, partial [Desulfosarcina sp.]|nr:TIGR02584 family CRISPR-associated protein [Desulfosarcina sp.]
MKNILLAVTGLSPQVITETLYALNQMNRPVHAIHVITTRPGKDRLLSQLLDGGRGPYYRYLEEYGVPEAGI